MYTKLTKTIKRSSHVITLGSLGLLLAACATTPTSQQTLRDGPPQYHVDASKIKDAVPRKLPLDKSANPASYSVNGHTYHVLKTYKGYAATGTASWYGTKFDGHNTSTGQPYDLMQMTAASKVLPIPCFARVTNLQNGKSVIVEVNDRGPFEKDRLMDLSYAAALKLGIVGHGTAKVHIATIDPSNYHPAGETSNASYAQNLSYKKGEPIYIQAAALHDKVHAEHLVAQLKQDLHEPTAIYASNQHGAHLYRVKVGPIRQAATAAKLMAKMQSLGINDAVYSTRTA